MMFELTKFNPWLVGCNLIMILVGYLIVFPALKYPHRLTKSRRRGAYCTIVVFCVFAFWGSDFFHVYDNYGAPDKPCGVGREDANPKLLINDT